MPPKLALLLCVLFILSVFIIDFKRPSSVSKALWIPLIWMLIIGSRQISLWLNRGMLMESPDDYLKGSPLDRNIYILLIIAGLFILSRRKINWSQVVKENLWIFLFLAYGFISILWSDFPFVSLKRWFKSSIGNIVMVSIILTDPAPVEAIKTMFRRCIYVLIPLSVVLIKYYPELARSYSKWSGAVSYTGVAEDKNTLGQLCLACGLFLVWNLLTMWKKKKSHADKKIVFVQVLLLLMTLWLLNKSNSATSLVCFILGVCVLIGLELPVFKKNKQFIGGYIPLSLFFCFIPFVMLGYNYVLTSTIEITGHSDTFWGRTELWKELINMGTPPLIGEGYESFWLGDRAKNLWETHWWHPTSAHNGYLDLYLNQGFIGLCLLMGIIISTYKKCKNTLMLDFDYGKFRMTVLFIALTYNVTEAAFRRLGIIWFVFFIIALEISKTKSSHSR